MRNYLFACLESEARLALVAHGMCPTLGVLHRDQRNRDSFALDIMEPIRPHVDAFLLDLLEDRIFAARDFGELPNGVCRLAAPPAHELALTLPHWRECLRPIVAGLAQTFREALAGRSTKLKIGSRFARTIPGAQPSPLTATPRKASQPKPYAPRTARTPRPEALAANPVACASYGELVLKRRRRYCEACLPHARHGAFAGGVLALSRGDSRSAYQALRSPSEARGLVDACSAGMA